MNKRDLQKETTKKKLIQGALNVFSAKGFLNSSIDDLTKSAGISHGNFFVHFSKREDLINLAIEQIGEKIYIRFLELAEGNIDLEHILNIHLDVIHEYESVYYYLVTEGPFLPEQARTAFFNLQNGIAHWLEKTVNIGGFKVPFHYFFNLWLGNIHYYLQNKDFFSPKGSVITKYRNDFIKLFKIIGGVSK